jgi:hypothetical protein
VITPVEIEDLVSECKTTESIHTRLVALNEMYLSHNDPTARVRAFDWLRARGIAPAGYDPLGPSKERRKALDAFEASQESPGAESRGAK